MKSLTNKIHMLVFSALMLFTFNACEDKTIYERLDKIESTLTDMQLSIKQLQDAYADGKVIKSIKPAEDNSGWIIIYSDGTKSEIYNGKDGITPFIKTDIEGYWIASYDNGETFQPILDEEGDKINATGEEGISVKVTVNADTMYVIQTYKESTPDIIINETVTPYTANASRVITKIEQNEKNNIITITLADGSVLKFNTFIVTPTGISILTTNTINLSYGTQTSIEFRVNPSNANISIGDAGGNCQIELDKVGTSSLKSSYVTTPANYRLVRVEQVYDAETQEIKVGQYRAVIEDLKKMDEYDDMVVLVLNYNDGNNDKVQLSSSAFELVRTDPEYLKTGLPVCYVNTPNSEPITSKELWIAGANMTIVNPDGSQDYQGTLSIKGRGNSTWGYPKKPYNIKLDKSSNVLGMASEKKWCLLANWMDRTLMRNAVSFEIARKSNLAWTPNGRYIELVLNGTHLGNYYLCEKIDVNKNRVNIKKLDETITDPEKITGGYIFELDINYDKTFKFKSSIINFPYMFYDPDNVNNTQQEYVENYITDMEKTVCEQDKTNTLSTYINIESFVDWWMIMELTMNTECQCPKSCYMYKDRNGKMFAGPVWDFDWATFIPSKTSQFTAKTALYYPYLFNNTVFVSLVKQRWPSLKSSVLSDVPTFIDNTKAQLELSDAINSEMWPISGEKPNGDEDMTFEEAVERLKSALLQKIEWLDGQINSL